LLHTGILARRGSIPPTHIRYLGHAWWTWLRDPPRRSVYAAVRQEQSGAVGTSATAAFVGALVRAAAETR